VSFDAAVGVVAVAGPEVVSAPVPALAAGVSERPFAAREAPLLAGSEVIGLPGSLPTRAVARGFVEAVDVEALREGPEMTALRVGPPWQSAGALGHLLVAAVDQTCPGELGDCSVESWLVAWQGVLGLGLAGLAGLVGLVAPGAAVVVGSGEPAPQANAAVAVAAAI
jgi:hypothetical protein